MVPFAPRDASLSRGVDSLPVPLGGLGHPTAANVGRESGAERAKWGEGLGGGG